MSVDPNALLHQRLRIKPHDSLPLTGWAEITRKDLPPIFRELGFVRGAEIGTAQGTYARQLCRGIPGLHLLCVDPYTAYERTSQALCDERYARAQQRLAGYDVEFSRLPSQAAAYTVKDGSLDFVYIDGDHRFDAIMLDLILWAPKVRPGGIVSGHDFFEFYRAGVTQAVRAYTQAHGISQWYVTKEKEASFFWVQWVQSHG